MLDGRISRVRDDVPWRMAIENYLDPIELILGARFHLLRFLERRQRAAVESRPEDRFHLTERSDHVVERCPFHRASEGDVWEATEDVRSPRFRLADRVHDATNGGRDSALGRSRHADAHVPDRLPFLSRHLAASEIEHT